MAALNVAATGLLIGAFDRGPERWQPVFGDPVKLGRGIDREGRLEMR